MQISPQDGNFDLLFTIDLSPRQSADLKNQLKLLMELINRLPDEDINEQRIRIAIITFGQVSIHASFAIQCLSKYREQFINL